MRSGEAEPGGAERDEEGVVEVGVPAKRTRGKQKSWEQRQRRKKAKVAAWGGSEGGD